MDAIIIAHGVLGGLLGESRSRSCTERMAVLMSVARFRYGDLAYWSCK
jgi:hypothetical protein